MTIRGRDPRGPSVAIAGPSRSRPPRWLGQVGGCASTTPRIEAEFRADYFAGSVAAVRVNLMLGVVLHAIWWLVDAVVIPRALGFTLADPVRPGLPRPLRGLPALVLRAGSSG